MASKKNNDLTAKITAANSFLTAATEEGTKESSGRQRKRLTSFYIDETNHEKVIAIAKLRNFTSEDQSISAATIINEAVQNYIDSHLEELQMYETLMKKVKGIK